MVMEYRGNNSLGSKDLFKERKKYSDNAFQDMPYPLIDDLESIGLDKNGFTLLPKESTIRTLPEAFGECSLISPVADCLEQAIRFFNTVIVKGKASSAPYAITSLDVKSGYERIEQSYSSEIEKLYESFKSFIKTRDEEKLIRDFDSFYDLFSDFMVLYSKRRPVTKTEYAFKSSKRVHASSMFVSFHDYSNDDDFYKSKNMLQNPNYYIFQDAMARYGFQAYKHAPMSVAFQADASFPKELLKRYSVSSLDEFHAKFFYYPHHAEPQNIKWMCINSYINYISESASFTKYKICSESTKSYGVSRKIPDFDLINEKFPPNLWLELTARIRLSERRERLCEEPEAILESTMRIANSGNPVAALDYLEKRIL